MGHLLIRVNKTHVVYVAHTCCTCTHMLHIFSGGIHSPGFEACDNLSCQSLMNADGLYLVSYYALLLNLKLCCCDYYRRRALTPILSLVSVLFSIRLWGWESPSSLFKCGINYSGIIACPPLNFAVLYCSCFQLLFVCVFC